MHKILSTEAVNAVIPRRGLAMEKWGGMTKVLQNTARTFLNRFIMQMQTQNG